MITTGFACFLVVGLASAQQQNMPLNIQLMPQDPAVVASRNIPTITGPETMEVAASGYSPSYGSYSGHEGYNGYGGCYGKPAGSYGDASYDCKSFQVCQSDGRLDTLYCPPYTRFNNYLGVCDWHFKVDQYCNPLYKEEYYEQGYNQQNYGGQQQSYSSNQQNYGSSYSQGSNYGSNYGSSNYQAPSYDAGHGSYGSSNYGSNYNAPSYQSSSYSSKPYSQPVISYQSEKPYSSYDSGSGYSNANYRPPVYGLGVNQKKY